MPPDALYVLGNMRRWVVPNVYPTRQREGAVWGPVFLSELVFLCPGSKPLGWFAKCISLCSRNLGEVPQLLLFQLISAFVGLNLSGPL